MMAKHLDVTGAENPMCGRPGDVASKLEDVDCEACLWRALADVQNGLTVLLRQLHKATTSNRVQVINPVVRQ